MIGTQLGKGYPPRKRNAARSPSIKVLGSTKAKRLANGLLADSVDKCAIGMFMSGHDEDIHGPLIPSNPESLLDINGDPPSIAAMQDVGARIRARIEELGLTQAAVARACGFSAQRFGNYAQGNRPPDIDALAKIAKALRTSSDWLLGLSEAAPVDVYAVLLRLLELADLPRERAEVIAQAAQEALQLLYSSPPEGDARTRAHLAAQFAWQRRPSAKPS